MRRLENVNQLTPKKLTELKTSHVLVKNQCISEEIEEIPECIIVHENQEYNINNINRNILRYFSCEIEKNELLLHNLEEDSIKYKEVKKYIETLKEKKIAYIENTQSILKKYNQIPIIFGQKQIDIEKKMYETQYIEAASGYYSLIFISDKKIVSICEECGLPVSIEICSSCGRQNRNYNSDLDKYIYEKNSIIDKDKMFEKIILDFEGKRPLPKKIQDIITKLMKDRPEFFENMSHAKLNQIIENNNLSEYKKYFHSIYYFITGIPRYDLSSMLDIIREKYRLIRETYYEIQHKIKRSNLLTGQFVLWAILQTEEHYIDSSELNILKTDDSLTLHNETMNEICLILTIRKPQYNWNFEYFR